MGTNYYHIKNPCPTCGRGEKRHIGKSSYGWRFALHVMPAEGIFSLDDWRREWADGDIRNEYDDHLTPAEMEEIVTKRGDGKYCRPGKTPVSHNIGCGGCVGHGDGPWDLIDDCFS